MSGVADFLARRLTFWANDRASHTAQAVTDAGATVTLGNATVFVMLMNVGPNTAFVTMDGTPSTDGYPLPSNVPVYLDVEPGMDLDFDCESGETATVHLAELEAA